MHPAGERWTVVETEKGPNLALHPAADFFFEILPAADIHRS